MDKKETQKHKGNSSFIDRRIAELNKLEGCSISTAYLASAFGVSTKTIDRIRQGKEVMALSYFEKLAAELKTDVSSLIIEDDKVPFPSIEGHLDWGQVRDSCQSKIEDLTTDDQLVLTCLSPEAFKPLQVLLERATHRGVKITMVYNDALRLMENHEDANYIDALSATRTTEIVLQGTKTSSDDFKFIIQKINAEIGSSAFLILNSITHHPFIGILALRQIEKKRWSVIAPYLPYKQLFDEKMVRDWGFSVHFNHPLFQRYMKSMAIYTIKCLIKHEQQTYKTRAFEIAELALGKNHLITKSFQ